LPSSPQGDASKSFLPGKPGAKLKSLPDALQSPPDPSRELVILEALFMYFNDAQVVTFAIAEKTHASAPAAHGKPPGVALPSKELHFCRLVLIPNEGWVVAVLYSSLVRLS
jgi:hypothetical protein